MTDCHLTYISCLEISPSDGNTLCLFVFKNTSAIISLDWQQGKEDVMGAGGVGSGGQSGHIRNHGENDLILVFFSNSVWLSIVQGHLCYS